MNIKVLWPNNYCMDNVSHKKLSATEKAVFGGGCFWCLEAAFNNVKGVVEALSGYAGGEDANPSYREVCGGQTGHAEAVQITFDPAVIAYEILLKLFFSLHDPTTLNRQGHDVGTQYRSVIFYRSPEQKATAEKVIAEANSALSENLDVEARSAAAASVVTQLVPLEKFYVAEDYHQRYFAKNPEQAYCQVVIMPKLQKFRQQFKEYVR